MKIKNKLGKEKDLQKEYSQEETDNVSDAAYTLQVDVPTPKSRKYLHN